MQQDNVTKRKQRRDSLAMENQKGKRGKRPLWKSNLHFLETKNIRKESWTYTLESVR